MADPRQRSHGNRSNPDDLSESPIGMPPKPPVGGPPKPPANVSRGTATPPPPPPHDEVDITTKMPQVVEGSAAAGYKPAEAPAEARTVDGRVNGGLASSGADAGEGAELYGWTKAPDEGWVPPTTRDTDGAESPEKEPTDIPSTRSVTAGGAKPVRDDVDRAASPATVTDEPTPPTDDRAAAQSGDTEAADQPPVPGEQGTPGIPEGAAVAAPPEIPTATESGPSGSSAAEEAPQEVSASPVGETPDAVAPASAEGEPMPDRRRGYRGRTEPASSEPEVAPGAELYPGPVMVAPPPIPPVIVPPPPPVAVRPVDAPPAPGRTRPAGQTAAGKKPRPRSRRARLYISHVNVWSVMRVGLMVSIAVGIVLFVAMSALWMIIDQSQVLDQAQSLIDSLVGSGTANGLQISRVLDTQRVLAFSAVVSVLNVVLMTLLITVFGALYNAIAAIFGGIEVTLSEEH